MNPMTDARLRYFHTPGGAARAAAAKQQVRHERAPPGVISAGLADALGEEDAGWQDGMYAGVRHARGFGSLPFWRRMDGV